VELVCAGCQLTFNSDFELAIRLIFSAEEFSGEDLLAVSEGISWEAMSNVLLALIREGFICLLDR
jgi:hypothetical protein